MNCPICNSESRVLTKEGCARRRECTKCGNRFTTAEVLKAELERSERIIRDAQALAERIQKAA
jgi:transcriptional regulator NrdR family protein